MPLPSDERLVQLANDLLQQFDTLFGLHPSLRPAPESQAQATKVGG